MPHFTYEGDLSSTILMQGDVLRRTPELDAILGEVHPFYLNPKNVYFIVLTQSCDLYPHFKGGGCKARYLSIAPVRTLDFVIQRHLRAQGAVNVKCRLPVYGAKTEGRVADFLTKILNNNESAHFYLDNADQQMSTDCVAFLTLSIALKVEHYKTCLDAKILQLTDTFQAKLGWLVGQMYSRVGTEDYPDAQERAQKLVRNSAYFVDDKQIKTLEQSYAQSILTDPEKVLETEEIAAILKAVPSKKKQVLDNTMRVITAAMEKEAGDHGPLLALLKKRLESDMGLASLLRT